MVPDLINQNDDQFDFLQLISPNIDSSDYKGEIIKNKFYSNVQGAVTPGKRHITQLLAGC